MNHNFWLAFVISSVITTFLGVPVGSCGPGPVILLVAVAVPPAPGGTVGGGAARPLLARPLPAQDALDRVAGVDTA